MDCRAGLHSALLPLTADEACNLGLGGRLVDVRIAAYLVDPDCKNAHDDHADSSSKAEKRLEKLVAELSSSADVAQVASILGRCSRTMATSGGLPGVHLALCLVEGFNSGALLPVQATI